MTNKELRAQLLIEAADALEESAGRNSAYDRYSSKYAASCAKHLMNSAMDKHDLDSAVMYKKQYDRWDNEDPKSSRLYAENPKAQEIFMKRNKESAANNREWVDKRNKKNSLKANPIHAKINAKAKNESVADLLMEAAYMLMDDED